jgi:histone-lysine N-methyltransferase SETD2
VIGDVVVSDAGSKGTGVFALRAFRRGEFIFRRRHGRVVRKKDLGSLSLDERRHLCELDYDRSAILLPPGCYLNHACDPNAMRSGVKVFAWRRIRRGEEITIDYRLNAFGSRRWKCACRSANCVGEISGDFFSLAPDRQRQYLPYAPGFIQREYRRRGRYTETPVRKKITRAETSPAKTQPRAT